MVRCSRTNRQEGKDNKNKEEPPIWRLPLEPYRDLHPGSPGRLQPPDRALAGAALRGGVPARWLILLLLLCPHSGDRSSRVDTRRPWPSVLVMSPVVRAASAWTSRCRSLLRGRDLREPRAVPSQCRSESASVEAADEAGDWGGGGRSSVTSRVKIKSGMARLLEGSLR